MIRLDRVCKSYDGLAALHPVTHCFEARKTHAILGSSGSGKSTLLRLISGLVAPSSGTIFFDDVELSASTYSKIQQRFGYVIQEGGLYPHLRASENASLAASLKHRWNRRKIDSRMDELAELVNLSKSDMEKYPAELSGGQRQRVGLIRALFLDPDILLLDEPLGALDPLVRADLQLELKQIFNRLGKTVLIVTHDVGEAAYFGHQILLMDEGRIIQTGPFHELTHNPTNSFVTKFIQAQRYPDVEQLKVEESIQPKVASRA